MIFMLYYGEVFETVWMTECATFRACLEMLSAEEKRKKKFI